MGITHLCENAHFIYKILQYTCFNYTCYTYSYDKCVWDMSHYNKLSHIQYARFQILYVDLHFGLFWSGGIPTMLYLTLNSLRFLMCATLVFSLLTTYLHLVHKLCSMSNITWRFTLLSVIKIISSAKKLNNKYNIFYFDSKISNLQFCN